VAVPVLLLQVYGGGGREDTGEGVGYKLVLDLVTTRVVVAVRVRNFVVVTDFVVLRGGAAGGWYEAVVLFHGRLEGGGVVLA
jgi:hypothetical protein